MDDFDAFKERVKAALKIIGEGEKVMWEMESRNIDVWDEDVEEKAQDEWFEEQQI